MKQAPEIPSFPALIEPIMDEMMSKKHPNEIVEVSLQAKVHAKIAQQGINSDGLLKYKTNFTWPFFYRFISFLNRIFKNPQIK